VARRNAESDLVAQRVHPVDQARKRELLAHLVKSGDWRQVLVFTRTKHGANRLAQQLARDGIEADAIHGNKSQSARTRALAGFKAGQVRVLVATDIAARGLDIEELPHVVNFDLPHVPEDYVHRIGRTGRAGSSGEAISLVSQEDRPLLADIERLLRRRLEQQVVPGFEAGSAPRGASKDADAAAAPRQDQPRARAGRGSPGARPERPAVRDQRGQPQERRHRSGPRPADPGKRDAGVSVTSTSSAAAQPRPVSPESTRARHEGARPVPALFRTPSRNSG